jgi:hypothetical protein
MQFTHLCVNYLCIYIGTNKRSAMGIMPVVRLSTVQRLSYAMDNLSGRYI